MTAVTLAATAVAAYYDARWRRVPNWLVVGFLTAALALHAVAGWQSLRASLAGLGLGLGLLFPLFVVRGLGAGDVKFVAALGAAVTYRPLPAILLLTAVFAAAASLVIVVRRGLLARTLRNVGRLAVAWLPGGHGRPPAPSIDSGDALLVPFTLTAATATWLVLLASRS